MEMQDNGMLSKSFCTLLDASMDTSSCCPSMSPHQNRSVSHRINKGDGGKRMAVVIPTLYGRVHLSLTTNATCRCQPVKCMKNFHQSK